MVVVLQTQVPKHILSDFRRITVRYMIWSNHKRVKLAIDIDADSAEPHLIDPMNGRNAVSRYDAPWLLRSILKVSCLHKYRPSGIRILNFY